MIAAGVLRNLQKKMDQALKMNGHRNAGILNIAGTKFQPQIAL